jgi:hypothetical protein
MTDQIAELASLVRDQMAEIDRLRCVAVQVERTRAENIQLKAWLDGLVNWVAGDGDALARLQAIYSDPRSKVADVIKSSGLALPFERSKPASVVVIEDWRVKTRTIRLRQMELDKARWAAEAKTIEHQPGEGEGDPAA